jgi:U3 small nucleolar RNA-associated protein 16
MFSRIVSSAKSFIKQAEPTRESPKAVAHEPTNMVTTRGQQRADPVVLDGSDEEESIHISVPTPTPTKRKANEISEEHGADAIETPSAKKRKLPVREKDEASIILNTRPVVEILVKKPSPPVEVDSDIEIIEPSVAKKHKKFGSEEPEETFFSTAPEIPETLEEEDVSDESSDDDAPEEVGAEDAARDAKLKAQSAAEAIEG